MKKKLEKIYKKITSLDWRNDILPIILAIMITPLVFYILFIIAVYPFHWIFGLENPKAIALEGTILFYVIGLIKFIKDLF